MFTSIGLTWPVSIKSSIIGLSTKNTHLKLNQFWLIAHSVVQRVTNLSLNLKMEQRSVVAIKWPQLMLFKLKRDIVSQNEKTTLTKNTFNVLQPIFWDSQDQFSGMFTTFLFWKCIKNNKKILSRCSTVIGIFVRSRDNKWNIITIFLVRLWLIGSQL